MTREGPIPVTCVTGFLGAGKTTTILGLLKQLPEDYKVVLVKNEYGDVEVDSLLASQSQITGVSEILNGCLCCTMVGLIENAMMEIKDKYNPDRIIVESSGSAFPATLALQIREIEVHGFKLDGIVTVIDCVNFRGYEDNSPSAKLQAQYTDLLLLSKSELCSERELDILSDHLGELNEDTPRLFVGVDKPLRPEIVFGIDSKLWDEAGVEREQSTWANLTNSTSNSTSSASASAKADGAVERWHGDEVEVRTVWIGGSKPGSSRKGKRKAHTEECDCGDEGHVHTTSNESSTESEAAVRSGEGARGGDIRPINRDELEAEMKKLSFEIYRVKGLIRLSDPLDASKWSTWILNYAFGRHELIHSPSLDQDESLEGVTLKLTVMGERGEVARRAKRFADALGAMCD